MTYTEAIEELTVAIGYALDATRRDRTLEDNAECRDKSERILHRVIDSRPFTIDPIIIHSDDIKRIMKK